MTPAEQNRAIAEWLGWTEGLYPDYGSDLNAIIAVTTDLRYVEDYGAHLKWILGRYWTTQNRRPEMFTPESWIGALKKSK